MLSFISGDTGIIISKKTGMVSLQMELGGDACIVLEDANLNLVAANIVKDGKEQHSTRSTGERMHPYLVFVVGLCLP